MKITLTQSARLKILDILAENNQPQARLRAYIEGGGCAGMNYRFSVDTEFEDDDYKLDVTDVPVVIDSMSATYLDGATIDYVEELLNNRFVIDNPNAVATCGCGSSFSVRQV